MTSWHKNAFSITGPLSGNPPLTRALVFPLASAWTHRRINISEAGELRCIAAYLTSLQCTQLGISHGEYHYCDVIMGALASQITSLTIVCSAVYSAQIKENIKAPRHRPLCGEFTGDRWIPRTNGQLHGKPFHLITSSCTYAYGVAFKCSYLVIGIT